MPRLEAHLYSDGPCQSRCSWLVLGSTTQHSTRRTASRSSSSLKMAICQYASPVSPRHTLHGNRDFRRRASAPGQGLIIASQSTWC